MHAQAYHFFVPPKNWLPADPAALSGSVEISFIGKNRKGFKPSINLAVEEAHISLAEYVKIVKKLHEANRHNRWRDLGSLPTRAGTAKITEIDTATEWGNVRLLQAILMRDGQAFVLTAAALKEEFADFYEAFEKAIRSFTVTDDLCSCIGDDKKRTQLETHLQKVRSNTQSEKEFQKILLKNFQDLGLYWQALVLQTSRNTSGQN